MYKVFPLNCLMNWNKELEENFKSEGDIYFTKEFFDLFKDIDWGEPRLFCFKKDNNVVLYPFLMKKIKNLKVFQGQDMDDLYDISTPYGYGGPVSTTDDENFIRAFNDSFEEFCKEYNVVSEFIRFHPLIQNQNNFRTVFDAKYDRKTVMIELSKGEDVFIEDMTAKNRHTIKTAQKNNIHIEFDFELREIDKFISLYDETMKRVDATKYYFFSAQFYYEMIDLMRDKVFLVKSVKEGDLLGMSLFFRFNRKIHYFLSGSSKLGYKYDANNLLLFEVAKWGVKNGFQHFHLGGGKTTSLEDPLLKFKKKFNKKGMLDFFVLKKIHNKKIYDELSCRWAEYFNVNVDKNEDFFPIYRKVI